MELLILASHTTYAMHGGSFLRFDASATELWSSNTATDLLQPKKENIAKREKKESKKRN